MKDKPNGIQRLSVPLIEFQGGDPADPRGVWSGYGNLKGFLENNYGSIFAPGCYTESIPSFLKNGFVPDSHSAANDYEYTILGAHGYPTNAREDAKGLFFEGKFHTTKEAQDIRTICRERADDGLSVGMSIGFTTPKSFRIYPKDYATELPKYLAKEYLVQGLEDAKNWPSILIRQKVNLIECSLTLTPAQSPALVTEVQSSSNEMTKDYFSDVDESLALGQINTLFNCLMYAGYDCFCNEDIPVDQRRANWEGANTEFSTRMMAIFDAYAASEVNEDETDEEMPMMAKKFFLANFIEPQFLSTLDVPNTRLREQTLAVVAAYADRTISLAGKREDKKTLGMLSGKVVSKANWETVKATRDAIADATDSHNEEMKAHLCKLDEFLDKYNPNVDAEAEKRTAEALNLRAKVLRARIQL